MPYKWFCFQSNEFVHIHIGFQNLNKFTGAQCEACQKHLLFHLCSKLCIQPVSISMHKHYKELQPLSHYKKKKKQKKSKIHTLIYIISIQFPITNFSYNNLVNKSCSKGQFCYKLENYNSIIFLNNKQNHYKNYVILIMADYNKSKFYKNPDLT